MLLQQETVLQTSNSLQPQRPMEGAVSKKPQTHCHRYVLAAKAPISQFQRLGTHLLPDPYLFVRGLVSILRSHVVHWLPELLRVTLLHSDC